MALLDQPLLCSITDISIRSLPVAKALQVHRPQSVVLSNLSDTNPGFAQHMKDDIYCARTAQLDAITFELLPPGVVLHSGGDFTLSFEGDIVQEQYISTMPKSAWDFDDPSRSLGPLVDVSGEILLVARYGIATWGHWLGELLPKVALAETHFPGRFQYALPDFVTRSLKPAPIWLRIYESIVACGVSPDRVFPLDEAKTYRFASLWAVTSLWSDRTMHPTASEALRWKTAAIPTGEYRKVAAIRDGRAGRAMSNSSDVYSTLNVYGYQSIETGILDFEKQVSVFKGADHIFGVLGSDLAGLIFSPAGVGVVTVAPDVFGDSFFHALIVDRSGSMADVRGPVVSLNETSHRSEFSVNLGVLETALIAVNKASDR